MLSVGKVRFCKTQNLSMKNMWHRSKSTHLERYLGEEETFTFEQQVEADDNLLPLAVQEIDNLCTEDKNTETDYEEEAATMCKLICMCNEAIQYLPMHHNFLSGIPDMQESFVRNIWELENLLQICLKDR
jgi:hypothetical protein